MAPDVRTHVETLRVRYSDADAQGIVHHSNYFRWLEEARLGWLAAIGHPYAALTRRGLFMPVTTCSCRFLAPVRAEECVDVRLTLTAVSRARVAFKYAVRCGGRLAATAATAHAYVNAAGRPMRLTRGDPFWQTLGTAA